MLTSRIESFLVTAWRIRLLAWARRAGSEGAERPLFGQQWLEAMEASIHEAEKAMTTVGKGSPWSADPKVPDDFTHCHVLARYLRAGLRTHPKQGSSRWSTRSEHNADHYRVLTRVFCDKDRIAGSHPER